ncbi:single-stranded-DNA-specific exonuclease RecJ [Candidatus Bandiella euplotis]|uniref:Single-stranded-DNA-specific exonuclease RecJ n=1 Tax=Candidatus Bandiella euplotis TaxID=1664265 RepID=A0ABZ0UL83_9RICK|nr:single-stranded-DNA-specific exonuclease RecJ [Candidatus Bandiella woodruffii]WPX96016.1 Single-stranded-DNA-specific exonuclease RecJ [Candidatus Bandiella woodruffii]
MCSEKNQFGRSARNFDWQIPEQDLKECLLLTQKFGISDIIAQILVNRGIRGLDLVGNFLDPKIRNLMPNPFLLQDMKKAANRIADAFIGKEKIVIYADYDVDGATSSAVLKRFSRALGIDVAVYIPCRFKEGYGPNLSAFKALIEDGYQLIITVDCGTVAFEPISYAQEHHTDVIVIDHHLAQETLPNAHTVVNPNRLDDTFPFKDMAAVGVVFFVITAVRNILRERGHFRDNAMAEPDIMQYLDLVALGTVCDVMPLIGLNRAFVKHGLSLIHQKKNLGLSVLLESAKIDKKPESYHLGFILGPRINAGGRVGKGSLGSVLLSTDNYEEAYNAALDLEKYNEQRKAIESLVYEEALAWIKMKSYEANNIILAMGHNWHLGVLGILASRIKEKYQKPVLVVSLNDGVGKGSARSIIGVDIGMSLANAKKEGFLLDGGGHAMAGGFSVAEDKIEEFYNFLLLTVQDNSDTKQIYKRAKVLRIDAAVSVNGVSVEFFHNLASVEPFGQGNERPRFVIVDAKIVKTWIVANHHIAVIVKDGIAGDFSNNSLKCMLFRGVGTDYGQCLLKSGGKKVNLVGYLQLNFFDQTKVDFIIEDFAFNE